VPFSGLEGVVAQPRPWQAAAPHRCPTIWRQTRACRSGPSTRLPPGTMRTPELLAAGSLLAGAVGRLGGWMIHVDARRRRNGQPRTALKPKQERTQLVPDRTGNRCQCRIGTPGLTRKECANVCRDLSTKRSQLRRYSRYCGSNLPVARWPTPSTGTLLSWGGFIWGSIQVSD
jgi:hypothetical protein